MRYFFRGNIGRIGQDQVVAAVHSVEQVRLQSHHALFQAMQANVLPRQIERFAGNVGQIDPAGGKTQCAGDADASPAAAQIEHDAGFAGKKRFEAIADQFRDRRPRNESAGVADELISGEPGLAKQIGGGNAVTDARPDESLQPLEFIVFKFPVLLPDRPPEIETQCAEHEEYGLIMDVIDAMAAMDAGGRQPAGKLFNIRLKAHAP